MSALALRPAATAPFEDYEIPLATNFRLCSGDVLDDACVRVRRFGRVGAPTIVALGGISAGRAVCGEGGWWREALEAERGVDLERFSLLGFDFAPLNDQRVRISPNDQAALILFALERLGVRQLHAFIGASYGAMVGLALATLAPHALTRLCVISATDGPSAQGLAWRGLQRRIVEFGLERGEGQAGLSLARQLAMITYRTGDEFEARFGAGLDADGRGKVDRYLELRGLAYKDVMAPRRWLSLSESIDRFHVDPARVVTPTTLVACPSDQLVPLADMEALSARLPNLQGFEVVASIYGHDTFLKQPARIAQIVRNVLETSIDG